MRRASQPLKKSPPASYQTLVKAGSKSKFKKTDGEGFDTNAAIPSEANKLGGEAIPRAANSGAVEPDLEEVVAAWRALPASTRKRILKLVRDGVKRLGTKTASSESSMPAGDGGPSDSASTG
jgi:hypothetical protein